MIAPPSDAPPLVRLSIAEIRRLPPAAAGDLVLSHERHGRIVAIVSPPAGGLEPPEVTELELVERAVPQAHGCFRKRWHVSLRNGGSDRKGGATVEKSFSTSEIAQTRSSTCPQGQYVHLNPGIDVQHGFAALDRLELIRSGRITVTFDCRDDTGSGLCGNDRVIRRRLSMVKPWAATSEGSAVGLWLGKPGGAVTEVRVDTNEPDRVSIARRFPAPA